MAPLNRRGIKADVRMKWLIILLILVAAFGPMLWMLPSKSDRRLAKMRARARVHGLQVEVTQLPDLNAPASARVTAGAQRLEPMVQCAVYRLGARQVARAAPRWRILRNPAHIGAPIDGWQWDGAPAGDAQYWHEVAEVVRELPDDALACAADASEVACWWRERASAETAINVVDSLHAALVKLEEIQRADGRDCNCRRRRKRRHIDDADATLTHIQNLSPLCRRHHGVELTVQK